MAYLDSIEEFIERVTGGIEVWVRSHGVDGWEWDNLSDAGDYVIDAIKEVMAESFQENPDYRCDNCMMVWDEYEIDDYNKCPECGRFTQKYTDIEYYREKVDDLYYDSEMIQDAIDNGHVAPCDYYRAMANAQQAWSDSFGGVNERIEEAEEALEELNDAIASNDKGEVLAALVMACHVLHMGGVIAIDYAGIEPSVIDDLQQNGFDAVFTPEEIEYFFDN